MPNFEEHISNYFKSIRNCETSKAMAYSMDGGKRIRPLILFSILKGMNINEEVGYDAALALEMIQTYSLIHDDLPAMDNDDMRRGKPSCHKAFNEYIALLAGDELLTDSFRVIASSLAYDDYTKVKLIECLSDYAGLNGMVYGQELDLTNSSKTINKEELELIQEHKTGGLFKIACLMAMYINHEDNKEYYLELGKKIGLIFQNQDDLFDLIKTEEQMGKTKSDVNNDKGSALIVYSKEELEELINNEFKELDYYLNNASFDTIYLKKLLEKIRNR